MSDVSTLLKNRIGESLEKLTKENVGFINGDDCSGFQYCIDGRYFYISVKELGVKE